MATWNIIGFESKATCDFLCFRNGGMSLRAQLPTLLTITVQCKTPCAVRIPQRFFSGLVPVTAVTHVQLFPDPGGFGIRNFLTLFLSVEAGCGGNMWEPSQHQGAVTRCPRPQRPELKQKQLGRWTWQGRMVISESSDGVWWVFDLCRIDVGRCWGGSRIQSWETIGWYQLGESTSAILRWSKWVWINTY